MFNDWKQEKAIAALVAEAQALSERLSQVKPHVLDSQAAHAQFWAAQYLADGKDLYTVMTWPQATVKKFVTATQTRIAALRKARDYDQSDGLTIWLHTARAVTEPRLLPPVREIWQQVRDAGPNATGTLQELLAEAGLPDTPLRRVPEGFGIAP
jgi:hypothetical protein